MQNPLEISENDQSTHKLNQNTLNFLDFWGIWVGFKLFCSFQRILGHFPCISNAKGYFLIILDVQGILVIYEVLRFDSSFQSFRGYFGHFLGFQFIFNVLELLRLFWSIKRFPRGGGFGDILWFQGYFGDFWSIMSNIVTSTVFFFSKKFILPIGIRKISKNQKIYQNL